MLVKPDLIRVDRQHNRRKYQARAPGGTGLFETGSLFDQKPAFGGSAELVWKGQLPLPSASATASADLQLGSIFNRLHKKRRGEKRKEKVRLYAGG